MPFDSTKSRGTIAFGPFRLDDETERLWRGETERPLRSKSFGVLRELVRKRGRLVTKEELFRTCWPDTSVSQTVLRVCIGEIRAALGEDALQPAVLETVGRRGYRLMTRDETGESAFDALVGRDRELTQLRRALVRADSGLRQVVFVTGEPGLGKTTLLEHFIEETRATTRARVAFGQCMELIGSAEAYLPVLDLLGRLCAEDDGHEVVPAFEKWAPSWLLQMPALLDAAKTDAIRRRVPSPNRDRMLREIGDTLEALAVDRPLVLVIEDLHWSDTSSIDALAYLAQRKTPARLLVVGSYRPIDLALRDHPLKAVKQRLQARDRCSEIPLELLTRADTDTYLARRLAGKPIDPKLADEIHARTDGNPLFMTATVGDLLERGILAAPEGRWRIDVSLDGIVPESIRQLAQQQLDRLAPRERRVLDAASTVGIEFAVATVAAASGLTQEEVEDTCATLAGRNQLVSATGVAIWPDRTVSGSYEFQHSIYREVLDHALSATGRRQLHRRAGERIEIGYAGTTAEVAAVLAFHFARAGDDERAVRYHLEAAAAAKARFADREVIVHVEAALARLPRLPETVERSQTELGCLLDLGGAYFTVRGCASDDAVAVHRRALEVADRLEVPQARIQAHSAVYLFHVMRGDLPRARAIAEDLLATAARLSVPFFTLLGHVTLGGALLNLGDFTGAGLQFERAHATWQPGFPSLPVDPTLVYRTNFGFTALVQGNHRLGAAWIRDGLAHAESMDNPYHLSYAHELAAQYYATAGERAPVLEHAAAATALATEHGFPVHAAVATLTRGWALRDPSTIREGIAEYEAAGQYVATSFFRALLIEVLLDHGRVDEACAELRDVFLFVERSSEQRHLAELHRLQGECALRTATPRGPGRGDPGGLSPIEQEAAACFQQALSIARRQGARLWELRAATSLAMLWRSCERGAAARALLDEIVAAFAEDCAVPELVRARALRAELARVFSVF